MALNGLYPVIIFSFKPSVPNFAFNAISGIPLIGETITSNLGIPIPIYLNEKTSGIVLLSEEKSIDIETESQQPTGGDKTITGTTKNKPKVDQRGLNSTVTINLTASRNSILLTALIALCDLVFQKVVSKEYAITYLNGSTTIFNGLLDSFSTSVDPNTDKIEVSIRFSKAKQEPPTPPVEQIEAPTKIVSEVP